MKLVTCQQELKERSLPWRRVFSRICTRLVRIDDTLVTSISNSALCELGSTTEHFLLYFRTLWTNSSSILARSSVVYCGYLG